METLAKLRKRGGRLFVLGLGGSAANAQHCVNDMRVKAHLDAQTPELAEWTARGNDEGWGMALSSWLRGANLNKYDGVLLLSGSGESHALVTAGYHTKRVGAGLYGIIGTQVSTLARLCSPVIIVPCSEMHRAGQSETFQAVVWHCVAVHPRLMT